MPAKPEVKAKSPIVLVIVVLFFLFLVAGIAGLYFAKSFNLPVSLPVKLPGIVGMPGLTPRATENDFSFIEDTTLRKHMAAQANATEFRVRSRDAVSVQGFAQIFEVRIQGEEMAYAMWQEVNGKKSGEFISIGKTSFVKDYKDNSWWKQTDKPEAKPTGEPQQEPVDFKKEYEDLKSAPPKFEKLGEEACGSLTCYKYKEVDAQTPEASRIFWFDTKKFLLRKEESGYGEWRATTDYEYDDIQVKAPSPTKDVPDGKNIYEYMVFDQALYGTAGRAEPSAPKSPAKGNRIIMPTDEPGNSDSEVPADYTPAGEYGTGE